MNCPECEKIAAVQEKSRELSNFVDWLREQGYEIYVGITYNQELK